MWRLSPSFRTNEEASWCQWSPGTASIVKRTAAAGGANQRAEEKGTSVRWWSHSVHESEEGSRAEAQGALRMSILRERLWCFAGYARAVAEVASACFCIALPQSASDDASLHALDLAVTVMLFLITAFLVLARKGAPKTWDFISLLTLFIFNTTYHVSAYFPESTRLFYFAAAFRATRMIVALTAVTRDSMPSGSSVCERSTQYLLWSLAVCATWMVFVTNVLAGMDAYLDKQISVYLYGILPIASYSELTDMLSAEGVALVSLSRILMAIIIFITLAVQMDIAKKLQSIEADHTESRKIGSKWLQSKITTKWLNRRSLHVVVIGEASSEIIRPILDEIFRPDIKFIGNGSACVFLSRSSVEAIEKDESLKAVISSNHEWAGRIAFIEGSGLYEDDLLRSGIQWAKDVIILNDCSNSVDASEKACADGDRTVIASVAAAQRASANVEIFAELSNPENKLPCLESGASHVVCTRELALRVAGRTVACNGAEKLISEICSSPSPSSKGIGVYPFMMPRRYSTLKFAQAALRVYTDFGITPISMCHSVEGREVVLLNPGRRALAGESCVFCISNGPEGVLGTALGRHASEDVAKAEMKIQQSSKYAHPLILLPPLEGTKARPADTCEDLLLDADVAVKQYRQKGPSEWGVPGARAATSQRLRRRSTGMQLLMRSDPSRSWMLAQDFFDAGRPLVTTAAPYGPTPGASDGYSMTFEWRGLEDAGESGFAQHLVVCVEGGLKSYMQVLVDAIRSTEIETWVPIIFLSPDPLPIVVPQVLEEGSDPKPVHQYPHCYWVQGHATSQQDLRRAAISAARRVIILCSSVPATEPSSTSVNIDKCTTHRKHQLHLDQSYARDAAVRCVRRLNWTCPVTVLSTPSRESELRMEKDTSIVPLHLGRQLLLRSISNPFILPIVSELLFAGPPMGPALETSDAAQSDDPRPFPQKADIVDFLRRRCRIKSSFLRRKGIPMHLVNRKFLAIFEHYVREWAAIPVALIGESCVINPGRDIIVRAGDSVLLLLPEPYDELMRLGKSMVSKRQEIEDASKARYILKLCRQTIQNHTRRVHDVRHRVEAAIEINGMNRKRMQSNGAAVGGGDDVFVRRSRRLEESLQNLLDAIVALQENLVARSGEVNTCFTLADSEEVYRQVIRSSGLVEVVSSRSIEVASKVKPMGEVPAWRVQQGSGGTKETELGSK
eukprot:g3300.t1